LLGDFELSSKDRINFEVISALSDIKVIVIGCFSEHVIVYIFE